MVNEEIKEILDELQIKIKKIIPKDKAWESQGGETIDVSLEDWGFCKEGEPTEEEQKVLDEYDKWVEDNVPEGINSSHHVDGRCFVNDGIEVPQDLYKKREAILDKLYEEFEYPQPGYQEKTLEFAKEHNVDLPETLPIGSTITITYPLTNAVVFESLYPIKTSYELIKFFVDCYNMVYFIEDQTIDYPDEPADYIPGMLNRTRTNGAFGIWGHDIGDLVLEGIILKKQPDGKVDIFPLMGS